MAQARWTRESAINYLANNPDFTPTKPFTGKGSYSTPYLKRTASQYQDAEQAGRRAPTTEERRGHARITEHSAEGHTLHRWTVRQKRREINQADLLEMYKRAKKGKKDGDEVIIAITGIINYIPVKGSIPGNQIQTLTFSTDMESLKGFIDDMADILDFANEIAALNSNTAASQWESVIEVSFAFPNPKK